MTRKWVVVEDSGRDNPREIREFDDFTKAQKWVKKTYAADEISTLDVMVGFRDPAGFISYDY